ncbi:MAG: hypothetical protein WBX15_17745 [Thermoanaerobaculia bacterium]
MKRAWPTYTARQAHRAVELYRSGLSTSLVAQEIGGVSREWVRVQVVAAGILRSKSHAMRLRMAREKGRDYEQLRREALELATEQLMSVRAIAKYLSVSTNFVKQAIPRELRCNPKDATLRRKWQAFLPDVEARRERRERVILMRRGGATYARIIAETGVCQATVYRYLSEAGLTGSLRDQRRMR